MPHSIAGEALLQLVNVARRQRGVGTPNNVDIWCRDLGHTASNSSLGPKDMTKVWTRDACTVRRSANEIKIGGLHEQDPGMAVDAAVAFIGPRREAMCDTVGTPARHG